MAALRLPRNPKFLLPIIPFNPSFTPKLPFHSPSHPPNSSLTPNPLAHQLFDQFSQPPACRDPEALRTLVPHLTPNTVEAVLKNLNSWHSAHDFFRWASSQDGFHHTCYTYNAMAEILSRARQPDQLKSLALEAVTRRCPMTPGAVGFLIRCLGGQGLVDEANFVFDHIKCYPNLYTYNCLLEVLAKDGRVEMMESRFREMADGPGWEPDKYTFTAVLQCYCNAGKLDDVVGIFDKMSEKGLVDEHVFTILIVAFCKWGKVDRACELIERMEAPSEKTLCVLIHGFVWQGRVDKALEMFEKLKVAGFSGDLRIFSVLIGKLCDGKELGRALDLYLEMKNSGIFPDLRLLKKMILSLCREGDLVNADRLLAEGSEKFKSSSLVLLYNAVLDGLVTRGDIERAHGLVREMMVSQSSPASQVQVGDKFSIKGVVHPNDESFTIVICGLCKTQKVDMALSLMNDMIGMRCKGKLLMYNDLINELCNADRLEESYEVLVKMKGFGFAPTEFTHNSIFLCLCKRGDLQAAIELLSEMRRQGHVPWIKNCTVVVQQLCKQRRVAEACRFLDDMIHLGFLPDMVAYTAAIQGLCVVGQADNALKLFRDVSSKCYTPDVVAHNILINGLCKAGRVEEAIVLWSEMMEKGCDPNWIAYMALVRGLCKCGRGEEALSYFYEMKQKGFEPDTLSYLLLIDSLFGKGNTIVARELLNEVRQKDDFTSIDPTSYELMKRVVCKLHEDAST